MTTATTPKAKLDADFEDGLLLTAEEVLPPDPQRSEQALRVSDAWRRLRQTDDRINGALERIEQLKTIVAQANGQDLEKALKERRELAAELVHAADDVGAASEQFAAAIGPWAETARHSARAMIVQVRSDTADRRRDRAELIAKLDVSLGPRQAPSPVERERLEASFQAINDSLAPEFERGSAAEDLATRAEGVVTGRFGDSTADVLVNAAGVRRWVEGRRRYVSQRTGAHTGISNGLRPLSAS